MQDLPAFPPILHLPIPVPNSLPPYCFVAKAKTKKQKSSYIGTLVLMVSSGDVIRSKHTYFPVHVARSGSRSNAVPQS